MAKSKQCTSVWVPPESYVPPPNHTRIQHLPLNILPWDIFQRLCARLAQRYGNVTHSQEYGLPGQNQEGIDIYIRRPESSTYSVWQCKRYQNFQPSFVEATVSNFLTGSWASKSDEFVLAVSVMTEEANLAEAIETQAARLLERNIQFLPLGITQISERLKDHPDLVDDFFGREWVREFCGREAVDKLSHRCLKPDQIIRLRQLLRRCYLEHFEITDPGLPSLTGSTNPNLDPLHLIDRFIPPDIQEEQQVSHTEAFDYSSEGQDSQQAYDDVIESSSPSHRTRVMTRTSIVRRSAIDWLSDSELSVVVGDPGIGKSTLLRCVLLDLLSSNPRYETFALRWGQYLPVWVPFAMWTRLVSESETECSLPDVLTAWLRKVSAEEDLITLVQQTLNDSRLLLFVDGIDEWSDETAARTALTLLEQFVRVRNVPAIASSRPLGYARIGGLSSRWSKARLTGFSKEQQRSLAERWFLHRSNAFATHGVDSDSIGTRHKKAKAEADEHIQDIYRDARLVRLAEVPLLLNGLIALATQRIHLPRSRFKAYEELTRLLLEEQPKRREKAAYARGTIGHLSQENRERVLAQLAWETHALPGSDALDKSVAKTALQEFCSTHLYKNHAEALEIAEELLVIGAEAVGILVEKSSVEIGFLHRSFQEFLAAKHLSNQSIEQQKKALEERFENPQWHDVFLCLCHLTTRTVEVDDFVTIVETLELPTEMELARQNFLSEIAFGDLHCSAKTAIRLAENSFEIIETGVHERTREQLIEHALDGLESDVLHRTVQSRIRRWYPLRHNYRNVFYETVATWSQNNKTLDILWHGLFDEEAWNQRPAAESLAKVFGKDPSVAERLFSLLFKPAEPRLLAYALHALCLGWGPDKRLSAVLNDCRFSADEALQSVAIIHRVKRDEHDMEDRNTLINSSSDFSHNSWYWKRDRIRALITGWPGDSEVKSKALQNVTHRIHRNNQVFDWLETGIILLEGFPHDDEVAEVIAQLFRTEEYPGISLNINSDWTPLVKAFANHQVLGLAIDDWLERKIEQRQENDKQLFWDFKLCLFSRSERAKRYLLIANEKTGVITSYQARTLLQGWGMQDKQAAAALIRLAESDAADSIADLLPEILPDKHMCRQRLLEIFRGKTEYIARNALIGLIKLGLDESDEEFVDAIVAKYSGEVPSGVAFQGISNVIINFPSHLKVRELALFQLQNLEGDLNSVAKAYSSDKEFRCEFHKISSPLPANLRSIVVDKLVRLAPEDDFAHNLLSDYDEDIDQDVKTAAAIGYVKSLKRRDEDPSYFLDRLKEGLRVIGPDYHERRTAAFCALLEFDRLDVVKTVYSEKSGSIIGFDFSKKTNIPLAALLVDRWDRVSKEFGESFWKLMNWESDDFLRDIAARTTEPEQLDGIINKIVGDSQPRLTASSLQVLARHWRNMPRLKELCFTLVRDFDVSNWLETAPGIIAAEILSEQFTDDTNVFTKLEALVTQGKISSALVIAICSGWPDSQTCKQLSNQVVEFTYLLPAQFYLAATNLPPDKFVASISETMTKLKGDIWEFLPSCSRAVAARFARDSQVRELAFCRLESQPTSSETLNFTSFLLQNNEDAERLQTWMRSEIRRQSKGSQIADVALDLSTGTVRSVGHVLMEQIW